MSGGVEASFASNLALLLVSAVSSFFCADCSLLERSFAVVRCSAIAALVWRCELPYGTFFASLFFLPASSCSHRHPRFREFASIPGRVYACSRSPGSSTRLCAVIHLCEGQGVARAASLGSAPAGHLRWVGSLGWKLRARGRPGGPRKAPHPRLGPLLDPQRGPKFSSRAKTQLGPQVSLREDACMRRRSFR